MDNDVLHRHRARIVRQYMRRIANLVKLDRFGEAANDAYYFASVLRLFEVQNQKMQESEAKDGSESQRKQLTV